MINHTIDAYMTTHSLTFRPGKPATFGVIVINRSDRFAAFELKILAPAGARESNWYRLSPEVSTAKPPGDRTQFQVEVFASPLPDFIGDINITIIISSPQLATERRLVLRLTVEPAEEASLLSVSLPTQRLEVYPHNTIDIPIEVRNLGLRPSEVALYLKDINLAWLVGTNERRLQLKARQQAKVSFQCCPPGASQALSREYPFTIVARDREGATASASGILEVLPVGLVQFEVESRQQRLPAKSSHLPDWLSNIAVFQLQFSNVSNLPQQIAIEMGGENCQSCQFQVAPETVDLPLGKETSARLSVQVKRPWLGRVRQLQIEAKARLSDRRSNIEPATQLLTLKVIPIVPTWLLLVLLGLLSALMVVTLQPVPISHLAAVNAVRFSGTSGLSTLVLSGADDCTIRSWKSGSNWGFAKPETLSPNSALTEGSLSTGCSGQPLKSPQGLLAVTGQAVRVLELIPEKNGLVFAGLEKGEIQAWDVNTGQKQYSLKDSKDKENDRVLSLAFTQNSRYLYSSYGSGIIRKWQIPPSAQPSTNPVPLVLPAPFQEIPVWAIALSPDDKVLISAGMYKHLIRWDVSTPEKPPSFTQISLSSEFQTQGNQDHFWSVAFASNSHLLATGGSDGFVTLWNIQKCWRIKSNRPENSKSQIPQTTCEIYDRWQASPQDIRSIRFTPDDRQLLSAGDDGRIVAWTIREDKKHDPTKQQVVATLSSTITSIDLIADKQRTLVVSGSKDFKVRLHLLERT